MSNNNKDSEFNDAFIMRHIKMIRELYEAEIFLDEKILAPGIYKKESFVLFDRQWLIKWKNIVGFEQLKDKCKNCKTDDQIKKIINEVRNLFIELDTFQKLKELGDMDCTKLKKNVKKNTINEESDFIPILSIYSSYFSKSIKGSFTINSEISKGVIFIHDAFPEKGKEQKLILLYKEAGNSKDFIRPVITLDPKAKLQSVIKDLKNKPIDEILNKKELNLKIIKPIETNKKKESESKEEEEKRKKAEIERQEKEEKERKEKEEKERKEKEEKEKKEKAEKEKLNFEKSLWNKYELLHRRYKTKLECFDNTIEIFNKILGSLKDQQKLINSIISKNYSLFPGSDYTQSTALNLIKKELDNNLSQITSNMDLYKRTMIDQLKKHKEDSKAKEKEFYNQFIKLINKYNDSKVLLEKAKNKYYQSIKAAEMSLKYSKSMKVKNIDNSHESQVTIQKLEDKAKELLNEAKKNYDKYIACLKDANKNREESIEKQKQLIKLYQTFEEKDGELISSLLKAIYNRQREKYQSETDFLAEMDSAIKAINVPNDNINLIKTYNSKEKPDEEIPLVQYEPQIDFEKASNPEDYKINHEIIKSMKTVIPDIMPNFDLEKEGQKQEMRELSKKIFVTNIPFTSDEKKKLMEYLEQKWSQTYFLIYLSKQRTNGRFARTQKLVKDLAEILNLILQTAEKQNDFEAAKNCMILSQTYYYDEKDKDGNNRKKYLIEFILDYKWLRTPAFWRGIIEEMIVKEAKKYMSLNPKEPDLFDKSRKECCDRLSNICFSQLLPYANNMKEFFVDDRLIVKIIDEFVEKYQIQKEFADTIYAGVISDKPEEVEKLRKEYKDNPNFENELMSLEEVKKLKGVA